MSAQDYLVDILLIGLVLNQMRTRPLTLRMAVLPVLVLAWAWSSYFQSFSPNGHEVLLLVAFAVVGGALGVVSGATTRIWWGAEGLLFRSGLVAAAAWILGMGFRLAFEVWATSRYGQSWLTAFSIRHGIVDASAWVTALLLMAVAEVVGRVGVIQARRVAAERAGAPAPAAARAELD